MVTVSWRELRYDKAPKTYWELVRYELDPRQYEHYEWMTKRVSLTDAHNFAKRVGRRIS